MALPSQTFTRRTDGLASIGAALPGTTFLFVGVSSDGAQNAIVDTSSPNGVVSQFGQGPLPEAAAFVHSQVGGQHKAVRCNASTPGVLGAVTASRVGSSSGTIAVAAAEANVAKAWQIDDPSGTPAFVDETTDLNDSGTADVDPWPSTEAVGDRFAIGYATRFGKFRVTISTAGAGGTMAIKYWNGSSYQTVPSFVDASSGLTAGTSSYDISWQIPADWQPQSLNGSDELFYIYFEVGSLYSTNPVISQGQIVESGPFDTYDAKIEIVTTGTLGTAEFRYTLDGGRSFSPNLVVPSGGIYTIPGTGVSVTFTAGAGPTFFEEGDEFLFASEAPYPSPTDIDDVIDAVIADGTRFDVLVLCAHGDTAATAATMFSALATKMAELENNFQFARAIFDFASWDTAANVKTSKASVEDDHIAPVYGRGRFTSAKPFVGWSEPIYSPVAVLATQAARVGLSGDLIRVASGALPGFRELAHDEASATVGLDESRVITLRTWQGRTGVYVSRGWLAAPVGSDFDRWQRGRVMDRAAYITYLAQQLFVGRTPRLNSNPSIEAGNPGAPGTIYGLDAVSYETDVRRELRVALREPSNVDGTPGHVSAFAYTIDRANNIGASRTIITELAVVPRGSIEDVNTTLRYAFALPAVA